MKIWEIKAQALRLMFSDTDIEFSEEEFESGAIYTNANTREKLVRMEDSIKRAIDLYYQYKGETTLFTDDIELFEDNGVIYNYIKTEDINPTNFGFPSRIDLLVYEQLPDNSFALRKQENEINFDFFETDGAVHFFDNDYRKYISNYNYIPKFRVFYKTSKINLPLTLDEMEYDINTLQVIPEDVQRVIPYFIKGELFEEDEPNIAMQSKNMYIQYLMGLRKKFTKTQTKVKSAKVFHK
jgi:hypothetical protein